MNIVSIQQPSSSQYNISVLVQRHLHLLKILQPSKLCRDASCYARSRKPAVDMTSAFLNHGIRHTYIFVRATIFPICVGSDEHAKLVSLFPNGSHILNNVVHTTYASSSVVLL